MRKYLAGAAALMMVAGTAHAETRVMLKSAKSGTSYYQMTVQVAEAVRQSTDGEIVMTVEESQGSVQNVMEVANRTGNYVFTSPPGLVNQALDGAEQFAPVAERMGEIRALFPIPAITMHFVVRADREIADFEDLSGKSMIIGKGTFGANEAQRYFELFGVADSIELADVELNAAVGALRNGQVDGFVTASSWPTPNVIEAGAGTEIRLLSMSDAQVEETGAARVVIPGGTYPGIDDDTVTTALPVGAYTTAAMDDDTAYAVTKAFWDNKDDMARSNQWWDSVSVEDVETMAGTLHPGALRYYEETGANVPDALR